MNRNIFLGIVVVLLVSSLLFYFIKSKPQSSNLSSQSLVGLEKQEAGSQPQTGKRLAGSISPYSEFTKQEYGKALGSGKIVFLDFYANWCPICRAEAPEILSGFNELTSDRVAGFRVNYNDSETDSDEKALAKEFGVTYQHTKIILREGKEVLKSQDQWDKQTFLSELNKVLSK